MRAEEAWELASEHEHLKAVEVRNECFAAIEHAAKSGEFHMAIYYHISEDLKRELIGLGYMVGTINGTFNSGYKISWEK